MAFYGGARDLDLLETTGTVVRLRSPRRHAQSLGRFTATLMLYAFGWIGGLLLVVLTIGLAVAP
jgi:hypothetical protein